MQHDTATKRTGSQVNQWLLDGVQWAITSIHTDRVMHYPDSDRSNKKESVDFQLKWTSPLRIVISHKK